MLGSTSWPASSASRRSAAIVDRAFGSSASSRPNRRAAHARGQADLRRRLRKLDDELDRYLAGHTASTPGERPIRSNSGMAEPPALPLVRRLLRHHAARRLRRDRGKSAVRRVERSPRPTGWLGYECVRTAETLAVVMKERCKPLSLEARVGWVSSSRVSSISTDRYIALQNPSSKNPAAYSSSYDDRPSPLV